MMLSILFKETKHRSKKIKTQKKEKFLLLFWVFWVFYLKFPRKLKINTAEYTSKRSERFCYTHLSVEECVSRKSKKKKENLILSCLYFICTHKITNILAKHQTHSVLRLVSSIDCIKVASNSHPLWLYKAV